jgi:hypothetical protein
MESSFVSHSKVQSESLPPHVIDSPNPSNNIRVKITLFPGLLLTFVQKLCRCKQGVFTSISFCGTSQWVCLFQYPMTLGWTGTQHSTDCCQHRPQETSQSCTKYTKNWGWLSSKWWTFSASAAKLLLVLANQWKTEKNCYCYISYGCVLNGTLDIYELLYFF